MTNIKQGMEAELEISDTEAQYECSKIIKLGGEMNFLLHQRMM
jgi:hypothetical protein